MLRQYQSEVLDRGPQACLPCNLSDHWITVLQQSLQDMAEDEESPRHPEGGGAVLATILTLLEGKGIGKKKGKPGQLHIPMDDMVRYYESLRMELALEEVHRKTDCKYEPATLKTIFTSRDVKVWREGGSAAPSALGPLPL